MVSYFCIFYICSPSHIQDWHNYVDDLKLFCHQNGYDVLVAVLSISDTVHHPRQQVAVYSNNTDILNQVNSNMSV